MFKSKYVAAPVGVRLGGPGTRRKNPERFDAYVSNLPEKQRRHFETRTYGCPRKVN